MKSLERLKALLDPSSPDEWFVTDGATAVGPVSLELIERGISAHKVPPDAFVRHGSWNGWRDLSDLSEHEPSFDPRRTFRILPLAKIPGLEQRNAAQAEEVIEEVDDANVEVVEPAPTPSAPLPTFDSAMDLPEAMLIFLATVVQQCRAKGALIHRVSGDAAIVTHSHGPRMFEVLGEALASGDSILSAARQGLTVLAEPVAGVGGHLLKRRLSRLGPQTESAFMVPVTIDKKLLAFIEVGRAEPFRGHDVAIAERLADELVDAIRRSRWT